MNGKALMSGKNLVEMEASDMMDCLHFLFEEDFTNISEDHARSRSAIRTHLYTELYGVDYKFKMKEKQQQGRGGVRAGTADNAFVYPDDPYEELDSVETFNPKKNDSLSPRTSSPEPSPTTKSKVKFVDADSVPITQRFNPAEALG